MFWGELELPAKLPGLGWGKLGVLPPLPTHGLVLCCRGQLLFPLLGVCSVSWGAAGEHGLSKACFAGVCAPVTPSA